MSMHQVCVKHLEAYPNDEECPSCMVEEAAAEDARRDQVAEEEEQQQQGMIPQEEN